MASVFIGVGSNIDPEENIRRAIRFLAERVRIAAISTFYLTEPIGRRDDPPFYNGILKIETSIPPVDLKESVLKEIETVLGRMHNGDRYAPRQIDLDILLYDNLVRADNDVTIPDPDIQRRSFLAVPLHELAPDIVLPGTGHQIRNIVSKMSVDNMKPLAEYTAELRREFTL